MPARRPSPCARAAAARGVGERVCSLRPAAIRLRGVVPGRYWIHLTVTAPGDRRTSVRMAVLLGQAFPVSAARHAADYALSVDRDASVRSRTCRRFSAWRVDFRAAAKRRCVQIDAVHPPRAVHVRPSVRLSGRVPPRAALAPPGTALADARVTSALTS
jgi:hypothetical protein